MSRVVELRRASDDAIVVPRLTIASSFFARLIGLWSKSKLADDEGLLLVPCSSVHTFWMRFPLDIIALDRQAVVLAVRSNIPPGRMLGLPRGTQAVIEVPSGSALLKEGERLYVVNSGEAPLPRPVRFLATRQA
jgi:uncharacterized membrane protein (UPF0127 family)